MRHLAACTLFALASLQGLAQTAQRDQDIVLDVTWKLGRM